MEASEAADCFRGRDILANLSGTDDFLMTAFSQLSLHRYSSSKTILLERVLY